MPEFWTPSHSFTAAAAAEGGDCFFSLTQDDLAFEEVSHTVFALYREEAWYQLGHTGWNSLGLAMVTQPDTTLLSVSEEGEVWSYANGVIAEEVIDDPRHLRNIAAIDGLAYACGMDRQIFRRNSANDWQSLHADTPPQGKTLGFEAIAGFSPDELYAVGWDGEIWCYDGNWRNCGSPVNLILNGVCCASSGEVYVCGLAGTLLKGRGDEWEVIFDEDVDRDFWDVIEFDSQIYVASKTDVYKVVPDGLELLVAESSDLHYSGRFTRQSELLWSIGDKNVFTFDGTSWTRID